MSTSPQPEQSSRRTAYILAGVVAVAILAFAVWWFTQPAADTVDIDDALAGSSETAAPSPSDTAAPSPTDTSTATSTESTGPAADDTASDDGADDEPTEESSATSTDAAQGSDDAGPASGTWTVTTDAVPYDFDAAEGTFAGFRVDEELSSVGATEAVGRTPEVSGDLTIDGTTLSTAAFTADLTQITSDRSQREGAIQRALNTDEHPEATFELAEPVDLGEVPPAGEAVEVEVTGDLTVNGTTVTDTFPLQGGLTQDGNLVVTGSFDLPLSDVGVEAPSAPIVVSVSDTATVEFQVYLAQ